MFKELKKFNAQQENLLKWHQLFYGNQYEEAASKKRQKKQLVPIWSFVIKN